MQEGLWSGLQASGQPVEWHFFPHVGHGFALADGESYDPRVAELAWKIAANFLERELNDEQA
jgi:dienelactone hydrolase